MIEAPMGLPQCCALLMLNRLSTLLIRTSVYHGSGKHDMRLLLVAERYADNGVCRMQVSMPYHLRVLVLCYKGTLLLMTVYVHLSLASRCPATDARLRSVAVVAYSVVPAAMRCCRVGSVHHQGTAAQRSA